MDKLKIVTIVGARPQFIKAAAVSRAIKVHFHDRIHEIILHSGQHYDDNMSQVFFNELEIPAPYYNLNVGSGPHGLQTAGIMSKSEKILREEDPDLVIVYGDTNTTLAGAIAASKLQIPVAHVEAGLRSFNKSMPEEINRLLTDHVSTLLFSPTKTGLENLMREGFNPDAQRPYSMDNPKAFHCGDVMYDNTLYFGDKTNERSAILDTLNLADQEFVLVTIHRDSNTDSPVRLNTILDTIDGLSRGYRIRFLLPLHPRTAKMLPQLLDEKLLLKIKSNPLLTFTPPVSFLEMLLLESRSKMIITDSGGVQKESYFFRKPCLVLRPESEWKELIEHKTAMIVDADRQLIESSFDFFIHNPPAEFPPLFGNGHAAQFILGEILDHFNNKEK